MGFYHLEEMGLFSFDRTPVFDRAVEMCRKLLECEVSLLTFIDEKKDRQFFKAEAGLPQPWSDLRESPLSHSFCKVVVALGEPLIISDARIDQRVKDNPVIDELGVIAYIGIPIKDGNGDAIAALCAVDTNCREWTSRDLEIITAIGASVSDTIKLLAAQQKRQKIIQDVTLNKNVRSLKNSPKALIVYVNDENGGERIHAASAGCKQIWEISCKQIKAEFQNLWIMGFPKDLIESRASLGYSVTSLKPWQHQWQIKTPSGKVKSLRGYAHPEFQPDGGIKWSAVIMDITGETLLANCQSKAVSLVL